VVTRQQVGAPSHRSIHKFAILQTNVPDLKSGLNFWRHTSCWIIWFKSCGSFNKWCSSAAGVSSEVQKHRPPETSPEQLLGHDQPKTNQRCYWPVIYTTVVGRLFARWTQWTSFLLILWSACACCKLFLSWSALTMLSVLLMHWCFWVARCHLLGAKKEHLIALFKRRSNFWTFWSKPRYSMTHGRKVTVH